MLHIDDPRIKKNMLAGEFGLEKEGLRVTGDGFFAQTRHPFSEDDKHIVRDFCENQTEINTEVSFSAAEAVDELALHTERLRETLKQQPKQEYLWPFSSPPYIRSEEDIPVALFEGVLGSKTAYRHYLSDKYGRYKMTFSGIHVNYSFAKEMLEADFDLSEEDDFSQYKNKLYLSLAAGLVKYGWILVTLTAASPLLDSSYLDHGKYGETTVSGMASVRCSEMGYWNDFTPYLDYSSVEAYAKSIADYVEKGLLISPSELYYPVRLKSKGENDLDRLVAEGVNHVELRMFDLNPLCDVGVDIRDIEFAGYLATWIASTYDVTKTPLAKEEQILAVNNFKKAAHFDIDNESIELCDGSKVSISKAGLDVIRSMRKVLPDEAKEILDFEEEKLTDANKRYAQIIKNKYGDDFVGSVMSQEVAKYV